MLHEAITSPYVDYNYYSTEYSGSRIPKEAFEFHEKNAEAFLHMITFDRVKRLPEIPDEVKMAICAMAETSFREEKKTPGVKSENIDGFSVTYADTGNTNGPRGMREVMYQIANIYLANTGLLYKGISKRYDN